MERKLLVLKHQKNDKNNKLSKKLYSVPMGWTNSNSKQRKIK